MHVVGSRDRIQLIKLVSLHELTKSDACKIIEPSFALSIDNSFHIHSIHETCEEWLAMITDTVNLDRLSAVLKESIVQIPFLMANSGIAKKKEKSSLQLRRLSLIHQIGQCGLPGKTLVNTIRWLYSNDDLSLQALFKLLHDAEWS